ncbi:EexN family lipoprotein [Acidiphilium sp. C61]|jgi:hypothetical protein|uniref:EexN family lipoprotein n=1 Tax=Acidiphilium sp. C61 TaxID=1671485 RepID=UPI00157B4696|nr:EexN family lipoprotein [Acidiphilium sp. C61]
MTRNILLKLPIVLALAVAPAHAAATHDVPWFTLHASARQAAIATCAANPGDLAASPDCINANTAAHEALASEL